jgi:hypothetical protein
MLFYFFGNVQFTGIFEKTRINTSDFCKTAGQFSSIDPLKHQINAEGSTLLIILSSAQHGNGNKTFKKVQ